MPIFLGYYFEFVAINRKVFLFFNFLKLFSKTYYLKSESPLGGGEDAIIDNIARNFKIYLIQPQRS